MSRARREDKPVRAEALRARARIAALVVILAFTGWMAANWIGGMAGLPVGLAILIDLICLGALLWALVTLIDVWRARRNEGH